MKTEHRRERLDCLIVKRNSVGIHFLSSLYLFLFLFSFFPLVVCQVRNNCFFASTQFMSVSYHPDESQIISCGTDRKITYWDVVDGSAIRIVEGSASAEVNSLAVASSGDRFVSGGADKLVKVGLLVCYSLTHNVCVPLSSGFFFFLLHHRSLELHFVAPCLVSSCLFHYFCRSSAFSVCFSFLAGVGL